MNASTRQKPLRKSVVFLPRPRAAGIIALLLCITSLALGKARDEIVLHLFAFILLSSLIWSFFAILLLAVFHAQQTRNLSARILPGKAAAGSEIILVLDDIDGAAPRKKQLSFRQLPAVLIRYKLHLATKDHKQIEHYFSKDFFLKRQSMFSAPLRGSYSGAEDELLIFDVFGFFIFTFKIYCGSGARLSVSPAFSAMSPPSPRLSGGGEHRDEYELIRADNLIEQRPYIPGDDPRRINWKLYGHLGDLFVREEDREPPPRTRLVLLVSGEADEALYTPQIRRTGYEHARRGAWELDIVCEAAFAIAAKYAKAGVDIFIGAAGTELSGGNLNAVADALAIPCATGTENLDLPPVYPGTACFV